MKRVAILVIVLALLLSIPTEANSPAGIGPFDKDFNLYKSHLETATSGGGDSRIATQFFTRILTSQQMDILNTYANTTDHSIELNLSEHQLPGWRLYNVQIDIGTMTAAVEKEVVGVTYENYNFQVSEVLGTFYSQLAQGFYKQPHDGALVDYSIYYSTSYYNPSLRGNASFVVRTGSSSDLDSATDVTTPINMTDSDSEFSWVTIDGENTTLSANTVYWAVIDGSNLMKAGTPVPRYPIIYWGAENPAGVFGSYQRGATVWDLKILEAMMNYTYYPWNHTSGTPLTYSSPQQLSLKGNSSAITSLSFDFSSPTKNITSISFNTNQSVHLNYNLTLLYVKESTANSEWNVTSSGANVNWDTELVIDYPIVSGQISRFLNLSVARSWDIEGLYEASAPSTNHTDYIRSGNVITCSSMTTGTWNLVASSFNHLVSVETYDSTDDASILDKTSILVDIDVNLTLQDEDSDPVATGLANLTVVKGGSVVWTPSNKSISNGAVNYFWDVDSTTSDNGEFTLEVSWANGTDAGYMTKSIVIFYPTSFSTTTPTIDAYTEESFDVRVYIEDTFTPQGLDGDFIEVVYSFDGGTNTSLIDHNNGTWTITISTAGKSPGSYLVDIFAEGYAIQNRSLQVVVNLIHDTESLVVSWSNTNDITYIESTELSIEYRRVGGTPIADATVNVSIDITTWTLTWDGVSESYKVTFSGSDVPPGFGTHSLTISAWKDGHEVQIDSTQTLSIQEESTTLTIQWSDDDSITYVESTTLIANYTMSDGSPVLDAAINVTIGLNTWTMTWVEATETYQYNFDGDATQPGLGVFSVTVQAGKFGYVYRSNSTLSLTIYKEPTSLVLTFSNDFNITFIEETYLIANYTMSDGSPVVGATVNVTIDSDMWELPWHPATETYRLLLRGSDNPPGFGVFQITVKADLHGYESKTNDTKTLVLIEDPTTLILSWSEGSSITYIEQTTLSASFTMSNGSAIRNADINVTIGGTTWQLGWHEVSQTYRRIFLGTDNPPGFGAHGITVRADQFGFVDRTDSSQTLTIDEESTSLVLTFSNDFNITFIEETYLIANYTMSDGSPVTGATVNVTIVSDVWILSWDEPTQTYRVLFKGSDEPPGIGSHALTVQAYLFGFDSKTDNSKNLIIKEDPTTLILSWSDGNNITYVEQTILSVSYTMSNGSAIRSAVLNVTIGLDTWNLAWHEGSETYRKTFLGTDSPPGFGTHNLVVLADCFGFVDQSDSAEQLMIRVEPTTVTIAWSNGFTITYVEQTTLSVAYRMSDATPIVDATVTVTIGLDVWLLNWNPVSESYETTFQGDDDPPGFGVFPLTINASKAGFESQSVTTESLSIEIEPTSLQLEWWVSNTIPYVGNTVLYTNYTMSNGSVILGAYVTIAIGTTNKTFEWNAISEVYMIILSGDDPSYLLGTHPVVVQATLFGYEQQTDSTQTLIVLKEQTSLSLTWNPDDNITYFESTTIAVRYEMSNGSAIIGAVVNVTIGGDVWPLVWNATSESYEITFNGSDNPPGYGTHSVEIRASKYGYEPKTDSSQQLTIRLQDTQILFEWDPTNTITYVEETKLRIFYQMLNDTPILGATVNITRGPTTWTAAWNATSRAYEFTWFGNDDPPGIGSHLLLIKAWKANYVGITDISQTLIINLEPTLIEVSWSNTNNITYIQSTKLLVNYTSSSGVVILGAYVEVTIGINNWALTWNATSQLYEKTFSGSDEPPGLGTHSLTVRGSQFGFQTAVDSTPLLSFREEPTSLTVSWSPVNSITYVESTTLSVRYETSSGNPISGATVNVTIGGNIWTLSWNPISETYEHLFTGMDDPPGLGVHPLLIQADKWGFQFSSDSLETLTITEEPTSFIISWSAGDNITYVKGTTLSVRYQMSNTTPIPDAEVNVTIDGNTWTLIWNPVSEAYERYFAGSDDPPGYGTHVLEIRSSKFGYASLVDSSQQLTVRFEDTSISFSWDPNHTITYVEHTKIRISYRMSNGTPIEGATVNITGTVTWIAIWNSTSQAYEYSWSGSDDPPGLGTEPLVVRAWKANYVGILDTTQMLTIIEEPTQIKVSWSNGSSISFTQSTALLVNYTSSNGTMIPYGSVNVTIGTDRWSLVWNTESHLYEITFSNSSEAWPGLGNHGLTIHAKQFGYVIAFDITQKLTINSEQVSLSCELLGGSTISYIGSTVLVVNYTTIAGVPIIGATVNVTIGGTLWDLIWDAGSETYRIRFNGSDDPPGFGTHHLIVNASSFGFDALPDTSLYLTIIEESTSLDIYWSAPNYNNVTYFEYTILYVEYKMSNGTVIQGATVNVTIATVTWNLKWNSTQGAYSLRFNGSDLPPGLGTHSLTIETEKYGFEHRVDSDNMLILSKDPTTLEISWIDRDNITYVEFTTLSVRYRMSNGSNILGAIVNATIGGNTWTLSWNTTAGAYQVQFLGNQDPPGLGSFIVVIQGSADVFVAQLDSTTLTIRTEGTTATSSWLEFTIDWTESVVFSVDFRDSYGRLIEDATIKFVYIDGTQYELLGTNGTYWIELNNTFDLGFHNVWANLSRFGYDSATVLSISFTVIEASTALDILWSTKIIDYLGQSDLTVDYYYTGTGTSVPPGGVLANISIDGASPIPLILQEGRWIVNLTGVSLDLGTHAIVIRAWVYGYEYSETSDAITVNEVSTDPLSITWTPTNLTIEYTDSFNLTVDYTYYGGDVPSSATVNVTIDGRPFDLTYSAGLWRVSIPGEDLDTGLHIATVSAWLYGYAHQTDVTIDLNVTLAANSFRVTWEPWDLNASYIDWINVSVTYTQDFNPIDGATVQLLINSTSYLLTYNSTDERWHFSILASDIGLGVWNVTVTANKMGYADGWESRILTISPAATNLIVVKSATSIYYDENITLDIYYQLLNTSAVPGAVLSLEVDGIAQLATWDTDHWTFVTTGVGLGIGVHSVYVHTVAFGFQVDTESFDISVVPIPTTVTTPTTTLSIYAFESINVMFSWIDDKNLVGIAGYSPEVTWPDSFATVDHGNGTYSVGVNTNSLHVGSYILQVDFVRTGYVNGTLMVNIDILELPIVLIFDDTIEQYENESIVIDIQVFDGPHAAVVDWGEIILELEGIQYTLVYDSESQLYSIEIWLSTLLPGMYTLNFTASAIDCETEVGEIQLEIIPKTEYELTLEVNEEVQVGQQILIAVTATSDSEISSGLQLTIHIVIERGEGTPLELAETVSTNNEGIALFEYTIPNEATSITVWAEFEGSISEWAAISNTVTRNVSPGGLDILAFIRSLMSDPVMLILLVSSIGIPVSGILVLRRRRAPRSSMEPVSDSLIAPSPESTPTAPAGEMDTLQNEIKQFPVGLTRTQIAKALDISPSKASALVKKLLETNAEFEEIIEGRLRRIRFRSGD